MLAQLGAAVVLVVQDAGSPLFEMSGAGDMAIPVAMISRESADALKVASGAFRFLSFAWRF